MSAVKFFLVVGFLHAPSATTTRSCARCSWTLIIAIVIILAVMALFGAFVLLPRVVL